MWSILYLNGKIKIELVYLCVRMCLLGHYSALLTWIQLEWEKDRDNEESNGKLWTTRSLSLFDSDDNVMIIGILDLIRK